MYMKHNKIHRWIRIRKINYKAYIKQKYLKYNVISIGYGIPKNILNEIYQCDDKLKL